MKVVVDPSKCVTAGLCVLTEETVFDQDADTGTVTLLNDTPPPEARENVRQAERMCPARAITVLDNHPSAG
jgi:ferredoxin